MAESTASSRPAPHMSRAVGDFYVLAETLRGFDGIFTDVPYPGSTASNCPVEGRLGEQDFDVARFVRVAESVTKPDAFLVSFANFPTACELREAARATSWRWRATQVWDKSPCRRWVSWGLPLKHVEYVVYFTRGDYRLDFTTGAEGPPVRRSSFGGGLVASKPNEATRSRGMLQEIVCIAPPRGKARVHPTQKPEAWSRLVARIVGGTDRRVLDPFCGSGALLSAFPDSLGIDLREWGAP